MKTDKEIKEIINQKVILWAKRIYVYSGNVYCWFWIIRQVFFRHSTNFEEYILWFFLSAGFYWFTLEHKEDFE